MEIAYKSVNDYLLKRMSLFKEFESTKQGLENKIGSIPAGSFTSEDLSSISSDPLTQKYFLLKELLGDETFGVAPEKGSPGISVTLKQHQEGYHIEVRSRSEYHERLINFLQASYHEMPEPVAWLRGENSKDTKGCVSRGGIPGLELTDNTENPRAGYVRDVYCLFRSTRGFTPVANFCRKFPRQFNEAMVTTGTGSLSVENFEGHQYLFNAELQGPSELMLGIGRAADLEILGKK